MRATSKVFYSIATYLLVSLIVYIFGVTFVKDDGYLYGAEWVGIVGMFLAFLLCMMLGAYLHFTDNRSDVLPEDWEEAETEDDAGDDVRGLPALRSVGDETERQHKEAPCAHEEDNTED